MPENLECLEMKQKACQELRIKMKYKSHIGNFTKVQNDIEIKSRSLERFKMKQKKNHFRKV